MMRSWNDGRKAVEEDDSAGNDLNRETMRSPASVVRGPATALGGRLGVAGTCLLVAGGLALTAWALPPGNDTCDGAEEIPAGALAIGWAWMTTVTDLADASTNGDPAFLCEFGDNSGVTNSLWYRFTPLETAMYTISTCADAPSVTSVRDTVMAIFVATTNECGGPLTHLAASCNRVGCDDDSCGPGRLQAAITTKLNSDTNYFVVVWRRDDGLRPEPGYAAAQLRVEKAQPRLNDDCTGATSLKLNVPVVGTTAGAVNDYQLATDAWLTFGVDDPPLCQGPDVVYSFMPTEAGNYSFKVFNYSTARTNDLAIYLLDSCPTGAPPVTVSNGLAGANRNPASSAEEIVGVPLAASQKVYLTVDDGGCTPGSSFSVEVTRFVSEGEPNNAPAAATPVRCGVTGALSPIRDVDYFSVGAPAAGSRLFALVDGGAANFTWFDLRVTTATDTLEYDDRNNDPAFGDLSANVAGTPLTGSETFLQVSNTTLRALEPYRLYAAIQPPLFLAVAEVEPNDEPATANASSSNYFYGTLPPNPLPATPAPSADVDAFQFSASAGDLIFLSLDGDPLRDNTPIIAKLELLEVQGEETNVIRVVNDGLNLIEPCTPAVLSSTTPGTGSLTATTPYAPAQGLIHRALRSGTYFARVSIGTPCSESRGAGDYLLSITRNCPVCCVPVPARFVSIIPADDGRVRVQLRGEPGSRYLVETSSDLFTWRAQGAFTAGVDGLFEFQDTMNPASPLFFRAAWTW